MAVDMPELTEEERQELDVAAIQRYLMGLTKAGAAVTRELIDAKEKRAEADKTVIVLEGTAKWIKTEVSAMQTLLRSIPQ